METCLQEISVTSLAPLRIGQIEDAEAGTGVTVLLCPDGMGAGIDIRGGGPASRETPLLNPLMAAGTIHAVVLGGGSAFGLDAAGGVMAYLEEKDIGYPVGVTRVPLVVQTDLFDLTVGDPFVRPDKAMGYAAAKAALEAPNYRDGNFGAGCGATVGKLMGMSRCMKSGIGSYAVQLGELKVGAVVAVNAYGDIYDPETGRQIAGLLNESRDGLASTQEGMLADIRAKENRFTGNTTIGVIITNAAFNKASLSKIAGMGHDGLARTIRPVHTSVDGDSLFAVSTGSLKADQDLVGILAADVIAKAVLRAVRHAESAFGYPSVSELFPET